jgi:hypothetical protein
MPYSLKWRKYITRKHTPYRSILTDGEPVHLALFLQSQEPDWAYVHRRITIQRFSSSPLVILAPPCCSLSCPNAGNLNRPTVRDPQARPRLPPSRKILSFPASLPVPDSPSAPITGNLHAHPRARPCPASCRRRVDAMDTPPRPYFSLPCLPS